MTEKNASYIDDDGEATELDPAFFRRAKRGRPPLPADQRKVRVTIMIDPDVVAAAKADGTKGWQTRVNEAARKGFGI